jgi:hypothetical protein
VANSLVHGFTPSVSKLSNISKFRGTPLLPTSCLERCRVTIILREAELRPTRTGSRAPISGLIVERILLAAILFIFVHRALLTAWRATSGDFPNYYSQLHRIIGISSSTGCTSVIGPEAGASVPASLVGCSQSPDMVDSRLRDGRHRRDFPWDAGRSSQAERLRVGPGND